MQEVWNLHSSLCIYPKDDNNSIKAYPTKSKQHNKNVYVG